MELHQTEYHQKIKQHLSSAYLLSDEKIDTVLPKFLGTVRKIMTELEYLSTTNKKDAISRAGHAMKGALLNLGLSDLAEKAFSIEKHQEVCENDQDCINLINDLKVEINKIL